MKKFARLAFVLILVSAFVAIQVFKPDSKSTKAVAELIVEVSGELSADGKAHVLPTNLADVPTTVKLMRTLVEQEQTRDHKSRKFLDLTAEQVRQASSFLVVKAGQSNFFLQVREPSA